MATKSLRLAIERGYWTTRWRDSRGTSRTKRFGNIRRVSRNEAGEAFAAFHKEWLDDPDGAGARKPTVKDLAANRGVGILIVEQNVRQLLTIADRVCVLKSGRVGYIGPAEDLRTEEGLRRAFME